MIACQHPAEDSRPDPDRGFRVRVLRPFRVGMPFETVGRAAEPGELVTVHAYLVPDLVRRGLAESLDEKAVI
jgi:hypothetical protein